jgi:hypothetical protein
MQKITYLEIQPAIDQFSCDMEKIISILEKHTIAVRRVDSLFEILIYCFLPFQEKIRSAVLLAKNHHFFSLLIIARSVYDLTIQIEWIKSLELEKQKKACEIFLKHEGREWYKELDPKMSLSKMANILKLNDQVVSKDMKTFLKPSPTGSHNNIGFLDFLSKAIHWNPAFLKRAIGYEATENIIEVNLNTRRPIIFYGTLAIRAAAFNFTLCWLEHFFPEDTTSKKEVLELWSCT